LREKIDERSRNDEHGRVYWREGETLPRMKIKRRNVKGRKNLRKSRKKSHRHKKKGLIRKKRGEGSEGDD